MCPDIQGGYQLCKHIECICGTERIGVLCTCTHNLANNKIATAIQVSLLDNPTHHHAGIDALRRAVQCLLVQLPV